MANAVVEGVKWGTMEGADEEVGVVSRVEEGEGGGSGTRLTLFTPQHILEFAVQTSSYSLSHSLAFLASA